MRDCASAHYIGHENMRRYYFDNAATSFPKAPGLGEKLCEYVEKYAANTGRSTSKIANVNYEFLIALREKIADVYNYPHPQCVIFTNNLTEGMNMLINGLLDKGDHVIVSGFEHNAVMRPLFQRNINFSCINSSQDGFSIWDDADSLVRNNTKALIINAACNITGICIDLKKASDFAKKHKLYLIIDSAQASPYVDIDMTALDASAISFTGHKGFLGPEGSAGFIVKADIAKSMKPLITGGTGSFSDDFKQPEILPDKFSAGTQNTLSLYGFYHSLCYVLDNKESLYNNMVENLKMLFDGVCDIKKLRIISPNPHIYPTAIISIASDDVDVADLAFYISDKYDIECRVGLHCSVLSCKNLGVYPSGVLRLSTGPFLKKSDIQRVVKAINSYF